MFTTSNIKIFQAKNFLEFRQIWVETVQKFVRVEVGVNFAFRIGFPNFNVIELQSI